MRAAPTAAKTRPWSPWPLLAVLLVLALWATLTMAWGLWVAAQQGWHQGWDFDFSRGILQSWGHGWDQIVNGLGIAGWHQAWQSLQTPFEAFFELFDLQPWAAAIGIDGGQWWLWVALALVAAWLLAGSILWAVFWLTLGLVLLPLLLVLSASAAVLVLSALLLLPMLLLLAVPALLWLLFRGPARA